jgi:hypothetical protein
MRWNKASGKRRVIRGAGFVASVLSFRILNANERTSMITGKGSRLSRLSQQKQRAFRVRLGVVLVLCALPVALALAEAAPL